MVHVVIKCRDNIEVPGCGIRGQEGNQLEEDGIYSSRTDRGCGRRAHHGKTVSVDADGLVVLSNVLGAKRDNELVKGTVVEEECINYLGDFF